MKGKLLALAAFSLLLIVAAGCGDNKKPTEKFSLERFLPQELTDAGATRSSEVRSFRGDSLWQYIDGGAELYHLYNFVEVATADYKVGTTEFTIDIYRFDNADNAFGLYSMMRPEKAKLMSLGVEGFSSTANLQFVKGELVINLLGYDESEATSLALSQAAATLDKLIPGTTNRPDAFMLFPTENRMPATDRYFAQSFLGEKTLTHVYCCRYQLISDTVTLFLSQDAPRSKLLQWFERLSEMDNITPSPQELPFDDRSAFVTHDTHYGTIIAGLRKGRLVGMVGYSEEHKEFFVEWLESLP